MSDFVARAQQVHGNAPDGEESQSHDAQAEPGRHVAAPEEAVAEPVDQGIHTGATKDRSATQKVTSKTPSPTTSPRTMEEPT